MTIKELYNKELEYWFKVNRDLFGVSPINEEDAFETIQNSLDADCEKYWNSDTPCKLARKLNEGVLNAEANKQTPNSYKLKLNFFSRCIDIYGDYDGKSLVIGAMPTPCIDLCWIINTSHYTPRVMAVKNLYNCVNKTDFATVSGEGWSYDIKNDKFECVVKKEEFQFEPTIDEIFENHLSKRSIYLLEAVLKDTLTKDNFKTALRKLPIFSNDSIFNYSFSRIEYFEEAILNSKRYAQPSKKILLGISTIILSASKKPQIKIYKNNLANKSIKKLYKSNDTQKGCLVRSESKIFSLENFRTCVNVYNSGSSFQPAFTYADTNGFFDSFKTVTSKDAGRQRLLLDNVFVKDTLLWIVEDDGSVHNMYEYLDMPQSKWLSCLSESPFCNNDKPKRIMMNAKMTSQAVPLDNEIDDITHRITARVGFTDIEGFTAADSIVISESFAKKLTTHETEMLYLDRNSNLFIVLNHIYNSGSNLSNEILSACFPNKNLAIILSYTNAIVKNIDYFDDNNARVTITWDIPFRLGDKITNLHGAKGTVGRIIPDDEMPYLTNKVGNMPAGPLEVIISGFSTIRRGSLGQIYEAWALASGIDYKDSDFIATMNEKYKDQMKTYSENSIVTYKGVSKIIPVGINFIMRLYHHASTKVSCSSAEHGYTRTLRFGEMEKLNLVANDCPNALRELGIRSVTKYIGSHYLINEIETKREIPKNAKISMQFIELLKSIGYSLTIDNIDNDINFFGDEVDEEHFNSIINKPLRKEICLDEHINKGNRH